MVEALGVVEFEAKKVDASRSNFTRVLSDKLDVNNFSKNVFLDLNYDASYCAELL